MHSNKKPLMNVSQLHRFLVDVFPQVKNDFRIESVSCSEIKVKMFVQDKHLRPGGTISGPSMFGLADVSVYLLTIAQIGPKALAVTTNISMDFMRKPSGGNDLVAWARLLKLGRRLSVGEVLIFSDDLDNPVARASMTYSIPPVGSKADV